MILLFVFSGTAKEENKDDADWMCCGRMSNVDTNALSTLRSLGFVQQKRSIALQNRKGHRL